MCLEHLHRNGIVHLDLKPTNIVFVLSSHSWKVTDLDNAALKDRPAVISYTPAYAAPEVLQAEDDGLDWMTPDPSIDMWSFGILAFEFMTGALLLMTD